MGIVIKFIKKPHKCDTCPDAELCGSFDNNWTDTQKDEWHDKLAAIRYEYGALPCDFDGI